MGFFSDVISSSLQIIQQTLYLKVKKKKKKKEKANVNSKSLNHLIIMHDVCLF